MTRTERDRARLLDMIRAAGAPVPDGAYPAPTYVSRAWREAGSWVWMLHNADHSPTEPPVGSIWRQRDLLRGDVEASIDRWGDWHVDPARIPGKNLP